MLKKWIYLIPAVVLMAGVGMAHADLIGHWRLDETSGTVAADDSGNGNDGTLNGDPQWVAGMVGGALLLDGDGDYVDCGNDAIFDITDEITLSIWVNANDMLNGENNCWLGKGDNTYAIKHQTGNYLEFFVYDGSWHSTSYTTDLDSLNGDWHHMAGTFDGTDLRFYLDGEEAATLAFAGNIGTATHAVTIGENSQATGRYFDGMLDDARIYNRALAPEEIVGVMFAEPVPMALGPSPADGSIHDQTKATLQWRPGAFAASHVVYFGESLEAVSEGQVEGVSTTDPTLVVGAPGGPYPEGLVPGATYYWRVDEVNDVHPEGPWPGSVWSFRVRPLAAWNPNPADGVLYVRPDQDLTWEAGMGVLFHTVYFGESFEEVDQAMFSNWMSLEAVYDPGVLEVNKTYYWRIDEFTGLATNRGDVWSFTTVPDIAVTDPDLVGWWTLDEGMGATAVDWSGHGNHGAILGGGQWTHGVRDGALDLADGAHVDIPAPNVETNALTMTAWVKRDGRQADWAGVLFSREGSAVSGMGFGPSNELRYHWRDQYWDFVTGIVPPDQEWFFMALVVEPTQATLYLNGTDTSAQNVATHDPDPFDGTLRIGQDQAGRDLKGTVDDVRLYNKVLSTAEIMAVMRGDPLLAWNPSPAPDAIMDIRDVSRLSWLAGDTAVSHDVYLGTDRAAVVAADTDAPEYQGNQPGTSFSLAGIVELGNDYSWRIDEVEADGTVHAGQTWTFTVLPHLVVEDFESYDDDIDGGTAIFLTWIDGVTNGTGSYVGYEVAANGTFGETRIVHGGGQSMPMEYDNTVAPGISEADRTFVPAQDWTAEGVTTLVIHFRGEADNTGQLYAKINGTKVPYSGDPADIASREWIAWEIDLASVGVNLASVSTLTIGVEGGGAGLIYVDDLWLTN